MASQVSPGVVIRERDLSNAVVVGASSITAAFVSSFKTGPVGAITQINSERELIDTFGSPTEDNASDWLVAAEFLNYGGRLAVVRAATSVDNATASGTGVLIGTKEDFDAGVGSSEKFAARYAGAYGNNYRVVVVDRGADQILTLDAAHASAPSVGDAITVGGKAGKVYSVSTDGLTIAVVLDTPTTLVVAGDLIVGAGAGAADLEVTAVANWYSNTDIASTGLKLSAIAPRPGTSAWASERHLKFDEVHVAVVDESTNTIVERLTYLSKVSDARTAEGASNYWRSAINEFSSRIFSGVELSGADVAAYGTGDWGDTAASYSATAAVPVTLKISTVREYALSGGTDDYEYTVGEIDAGYDLFLDTEEAEIDFVLGGGSITWSTGESGYADAEAATLGKYAAAVALATSRADCVAFVSPYVGNQVATSGNAALSSSQQRDKTIAFFDGLPSTSYAVFDSGIKYTYDRFNDKYRYIACNGDVAGLCVRTSLALNDWYSPAGVNKGGLRNVVKLAYNPGKADRDELYTARINPIVSLAGSGPVLFGDKTALASPSAFDRINVRRLFLNIEKRARQLSRSVLFEQNDSLTRGGFASAMNGFLAQIKADRGLTDYFVVCDESNNTPAVIDANEFVAEIYLQPTRSINYVTVTLTATRTGVSFSEIIGR
jgi:hypothetical protein